MHDMFTPAGILGLTKRLVSIPSVTGSPQENEAAQFIHELFRGSPYFREHPEHLRIFPAEEAGLKRCAVLAFVRASRPTARTVLLNGHFDVVGSAPAAFDAEAYTGRLRAECLPADAAADLESGNWLFGRGVMDMKCGLALFIAYMLRMASRRDEFGVNLLFLAVPDEEGDSAGMRGALPHLNAFILENSLDLAAALSGEPAFWSPGCEGEKGERVFFTGTTGKIMPVFFCLGREAHAGFCFEGISAAAIASEVVRQMEGNAEFIDRAGDEFLPPPVCLKLKDLREAYSVTLPERAVTYFNVLTATRAPAQILGMCVKAAGTALDAAIESQRQAFRAYAERSGTKADLPRREPRVCSFSEVLAALERKMGSKDAVRDMIGAFIGTLDPETDCRDKGIAVIDRAVTEAGISGPAIVVGFLPPYYPHRINLRKSAGERLLRSAMETVCAEAGERAGNVRLVECFTGIMDLSFMGFQGERSDLLALAGNMPGWGEIYSLPMDDLLSLDVPIANAGPAGKDAHSAAERLELGFSLEESPRMLERLIGLLAAGGP